MHSTLHRRLNVRCARTRNGGKGTRLTVPRCASAGLTLFLSSVMVACDLRSADERPASSTGDRPAADEDVGTVRAALVNPPTSYVAEVLQDQPAGYWRLGEKTYTDP